MNKLDRILKLTFLNEGVDADLPGDPGGKTRYGITWRTARRHGIKDVTKLTKGQARMIYMKDYWNPVKAENFTDDIAYQIFDMGVNAGTRVAGKILQKSINEYNNNKKLKVDGIIGRATIGAYNKVRYKRALLSLIIANRVIKYKLIALNPIRRKFLNSWLRRTAVEG